MEAVDLRQLKMFQALAETRSFTLAARRLFVTQSAVSHSIKSLERSLECRLFDRSGRSIALTEEGSILLRRCERIFDEMRLATEELASLNSWGHGRLRVGATMTMCQYLLPLVFREFRESFPHCDIRIEPGDTEELLALLESGEIDLALGLRLPRENRFETRQLLSDELALILAPTHPWVNKPKLKPDDFESERFIVYARNSYTFRLVERYFDKQGTTLKSPLELASMEAIKELTKIGLGVGVVAPWIASEEIARGTLVARRLNRPRVTRDWVLLYQKNRPLTLAEETFAGISEIVARSFTLERGTGGLTSTA